MAIVGAIVVAIVVAVVVVVVVAVVVVVVVAVVVAVVLAVACNHYSLFTTQRFIRLPHLGKGHHCTMQVII